MRRQLWQAIDLLDEALTLGQRLVDSKVVTQAEAGWSEARRIAFRKTLADSDTIAVIVVLLTSYLAGNPEQSQSSLARALCQDYSKREFAAVRWRVGKIVTRLKVYGLVEVVPREKQGLANKVTASETLRQLFESDLAPGLVKAAHKTLRRKENRS